jgi:ribonuclease BN (tRNA processing enzyme)
VKVTVLGKSPSWQDAGGACSGYLVQEGDTTLLLDCGNGVFGKLRRHVDYVDVDAVVLSHLHADHFLDLVPYAYALTYAPRQQPVPVHVWPGTGEPARPQLHAPPGAQAVFRRVAGAWGNDDLIELAFGLREYDPRETIEVGPLRLRFRRVPHYLPTYAIEITSTVAASGRFTYGADCSPTEDLVDFARDTDLLLIEATLPRPERTGIRGHLTPAEAGEHGRAAGARRLVITHVSDELSERWARDEAERTYGATVEVAREGAVYAVRTSTGRSAVLSPAPPVPMHPG